MQVVAIGRYPVKSLLGEQVARVAVDARGVVGDRAWAVRTQAGSLGSGKSTRRFEKVGGLLMLRASVDGDDVVFTLPDGASFVAGDPAADEALTRFLGRPVTLARESSSVSHYDDGPVSLLGQASVDAVTEQLRNQVEPARFRANLLLSGDRPFVEDGWVGREVAIGSAVLRVTAPLPRCVMVDLPTADLPDGGGVLKAVGAAHEAHLGVVATVLTPGTAAVGDEVRPL